MNNESDLTNIALISDILIQVTALQRILINKGLISQDELVKEISFISRSIAKSMLESAKVTGDIDKIVDDLINGKSEKDS